MRGPANSVGLSNSELLGTNVLTGTPKELTITGSYSGKSGTASVASTQAVLQSLILSPPTLSLAKGTEQAMSAAGLFSDQSRLDLTHDVAWTVDSTPPARCSEA